MLKIIFFIAFAFRFHSAFSFEASSVLFVGDSHSYGKFGQALEKKLSSKFHRVVMESSCGSTPGTWLGKTGYERTVCGFWRKDGEEETRSVEHKIPKFADELALINPSLTIIQLGTNIAAGEKPSHHKSNIEAMMKLSIDHQSQCIWIGPPDANSKIVTKEKLQETNELIKSIAIAYGCIYIDSLLLTKFPLNEKEGIHYPPTLSLKWGEDVGNIILNLK